MANKLIDFGKQIWKNMSPIGKKLLVIVSMFLAGELFPWEIFGSMGTYIKAGLILGAIFLIVKLFDAPKEKGKKQTKKKKAKKKTKKKKKTTKKANEKKNKGERKVKRRIIEEFE